MILVRVCPLLMIATLLMAQLDPAVGVARRFRQAHEREIVTSLMELLAIPNVPDDPSNLRRNAEFIANSLRHRGVKTQLLEVEGAAPVVFGELAQAGAAKTVVLYAHYDGSPVSAAEWTTAPFKPVLRSGSIERDGQIIPLPSAGTALNPEWRIYARSAGDDKAPIIAMLSALDALREAGRRPTMNLKFVFEGEEEAGSTHLEKIIAKYKTLLRSDVWLICDGPVHQSRNAQIAFGARGIVTATLTVYGPRRELHSGHYGNWSPNPAFVLAKLLASMKDEDGRVLIRDFYEGMEPLGAVEKRALQEMPNFDDQLKKELWLGRTEGAPRTLPELITLPSLNIRGMSSGRSTNASNVIPSSATAAIDMRLVRGISHQQTIARLKAHIQEQGFYVTDQPPDATLLMAHPKVVYLKTDEFGYDAVRTPMDLPIAQSVMAAAARARTPVMKLPTMGGSLPLIMIERPLGVHTIVIPIANHDNNQHSFNENLRVQNLWDGIELMAALFTME
jgi:acetylornithine deacetylase/succinyl-diaminopimelate desuccinylase-like protein